MLNSDKRIFSLPPEQRRFVDDLVASGAHASAREVVRAGLRALQEKDEAVESWLREEVAPAYDAVQAHPSRGVPADDVFAAIRARHAERLKSDVLTPPGPCSCLNTGPISLATNAFEESQQAKWEQSCTSS